jgi:hypothetical protein
MSAFDFYFSLIFFHQYLNKNNYVTLLHICEIISNNNTIHFFLRSAANNLRRFVTN